MAKGTRKGGKKGGKKSRKLSPKLREWNQRVMAAFREGRKKNPNYKLKDAMKDAKKSA
jgi:hypothetical protein